MKVMRLEDFKENGNNATFNEICDWAGIDQLNWEDYTDFTYHKGNYKGEVREETRQWLREFFKIPIMRVNTLMDLNLNWGY